jgi:hypothetical protein
MTSINIPNIGQRIRVALHYAGVWRPLVWLRVGSDGSVYIGLLVSAATYGRALSKEVAGRRSVTIQEGQGQTLPLAALRKGSRISFKASGEIHLAAKVIQGTSLERLAGPTQLCVVRFAHPVRYRPPKKKLGNDYDVGIAGYGVDDTRPMVGILMVTPWASGAPMPIFPRPTYAPAEWIERGALLFGFRGLRRTPDIGLKLSFGDFPRGSWPEYPAIAVSQG